MAKLRLNKAGFGILETLFVLSVLTVCLTSLGYFWVQFHRAQVSLLSFDQSLDAAQNSLESARAGRVIPTSNLTVLSLGNGLQKATYRLDSAHILEVVY